MLQEKLLVKLELGETEETDSDYDEVSHRNVSSGRFMFCFHLRLYLLLKLKQCHLRLIQVQKGSDIESLSPVILNFRKGMPRIRTDWSLLSVILKDSFV